MDKYGEWLPHEKEGWICSGCGIRSKDKEKKCWFCGLLMLLEVEK